MNILEVAGNLIGSVGKQTVFWAATLTFSGYIYNKISNFSKSFGEETIRKVRAQLANLEDENIQMAAIHAIRYVANKFPEADNNEKLQIAIKKVQEITPDIIVSDKKVEIIIESLYSQIKKDLQIIQA